MARPKRNEKEISRKRVDIIEAAARVFAKNGVAATSMQDIAREAGFSAPSLYAYFAGKDAIFGGLVSLMTEEFERLFDLRFPASLTLSQKLEMLIHHHFEWADKRRDAFVVLMSLDIMGHPGVPGRSRSQREGDAAYIRHLQNWLKANANREDLGKTSHEEAAYVLWGISQGFVHRWFRVGGKQPLAAGAARAVEIFLHGIAGDRSPEGRAVR